MTKNFANRFGLVALALSLFASTAFAGNAPGSTPVVVTNTTGQPVPVTVQNTQLYQATQTVDCTNAINIAFNFNVPTGKTLIVHNLNVFAGSHAQDTFGFYIYADLASANFLGFAMQPVGGSFGSYTSAWSLNQQVQISAIQYVQGFVSRNSMSWGSGCSANVTISGELR
jgi:hypothetical protein